MDVDAILASLETGRAGVLEQWLDENPERTAKFWRLVEGAQKKRVGIDKAIAAWNAAVDASGDPPEDRCPVKQNQVRLALRLREAERREVA